MPTIVTGSKILDARIPFMDWADKPFALASKAVTGPAKWTGKRFMGGLKGLGKGAAVVGGLALGAYAASSLINSMRSSPSPEPEPQPHATPMIDPYTEMGLVPPPMDMAMAGPQQETMMGMAPVEGSHVQRLMAARGGRQMDMGNPNPATPDVDGRQVQDMGSIGMGR